MDFADFRQNPLKSALRGPEVSEFLNLGTILATLNINQNSHSMLFSNEELSHSSRLGPVPGRPSQAIRHHRAQRALTRSLKKTSLPLFLPSLPFSPLRLLPLSFGPPPTSHAASFSPIRSRTSVSFVLEMQCIREISSLYAVAGHINVKVLYSAHSCTLLRRV